MAMEWNDSILVLLRLKGAAATQRRLQKVFTFTRWGAARLYMTVLRLKRARQRAAACVAIGPDWYHTQAACWMRLMNEPCGRAGGAVQPSRYVSCSPYIKFALHQSASCVCHRTSTLYQCPFCCAGAATHAACLLQLLAHGLVWTRVTAATGPRMRLVIVAWARGAGSGAQPPLLLHAYMDPRAHAGHHGRAGGKPVPCMICQSGPQRALRTIVQADVAQRVAWCLMGCSVSRGTSIAFLACC